MAFNDGYTRLRNAIIFQAIDDWKKKPNLRSEIGKFFKSEWCDFLLSDTKLDGNTIKKRLRKIKMPERREW